MKRVAVVTMVYNEPEYLPIWCSYYGAEFGPEHCYIIDHGSDDGSTDGLTGFNVIRIPRTPKDNDKRARFMSQFCGSLLEWYDLYVHVDIDEILVPVNTDSLLGYLHSTDMTAVSAYGLDVHHDPGDEPDILLHKPISWQRRWVRFSSSMCKVVASNSPIRWSAGFHSANSSLKFAEIYLFHLRYFDLKLGLRRLSRTRAMQWARADAGGHQRIDNTSFEDLIRNVAILPRMSMTSLYPDDAPLAEYIAQVRSSETDYRDSTYNIDLHIFGDCLWEIPSRLIGRF